MAEVLARPFGGARKSPPRPLRARRWRRQAPVAVMVVTATACPEDWGGALRSHQAIGDAHTAAGGGRVDGAADGVDPLHAVVAQPAVGVGGVGVGGVKITSTSL